MTRLVVCLRAAPRVQWFVNAKSHYSSTCQSALTSEIVSGGDIKSRMLGLDLGLKPESSSTYRPRTGVSFTEC